MLKIKKDKKNESLKIDWFDKNGHFIKIHETLFTSKINKDQDENSSEIAISMLKEILKSFNDLIIEDMQKRDFRILKKYFNKILLIIEKYLEE